MISENKPIMTISQQMEVVTDKLAQLSVDTATKKKSRKNLTAYWGIELDTNIFDHQHIHIHLTEKPDLIKLDKIHSTLLYVGKKDDNPHEDKYHHIEGKDCQLTISKFGCSTDAMALFVDKITYHNEQHEEVNVPTHAIQQHVTMALKKGVKAVDSIKCFEHGLIDLPEPLVIRGKIKRYLW